MRSRYFLGILLAALALAGPASARSLDSILPGIRAEHPGRLSDATPWTDSEGRTHYRIKWMTPEGRILYFDADADSGHYRNSGGGEYDGGQSRGGYSQGDREDGDRGGGHRNWNGGGDTAGEGDWRGRHNSGGGDWGDRRDSGSGGWHGRNGGGDWHGGQGGGDGGRGGHHHHGGGD